MKAYGPEFYADRHQRTVHAARAVLAVVSEVLPPIRSAVDLGCGVGTWLSVLAENGVAEVLGVDGAWVTRDRLEIPPSAFLEADLTAPIQVGRRFDLAISLEVAEHLPASCADRFVSSLADLSDFILFSAAVPFQGGVHHVNEQWPEYWAERFRRLGYVPWDSIRHRIWHDPLIPVWYRQNVVLFVRRERVGDLRVHSIGVEDASDALSRLHPELFQGMVNEWHSVRGSSRLLGRALRRWVGRRLRHD
jgi:SAM-dependent methyltransferase